MGSKRIKTWSVVVMASLAGVVACSSKTTGSGTSGTGGKSGGLFGTPGGGTSGTSGTSGTTAGTAGPTDVPTSCSASAGDDACTACLKQSCCDSTLGCANNTECRAIFSCANDCTEQTCFDSCIQAHPSGQTALKALVSCEQQSCVAACGGDSSGSTGGTSGTSGTSGSSGGDTCLPSDLGDPSLYCPDMPTRQTVKDCPNGPPSAQCVLSPSGASNVYCCP